MHRIVETFRTFGPACGLACGLALASLPLAPDAHAGDPIPQGATVRITKVSKADAFFRQRDSIVGLVCGVDEGGLDPSTKKWYGGSVTCGAAGNFYFYQVAVEVGDFGIDYASLTAAANVPVVAPTADNPWPTGARVRITGVSPEDAHIDDTATLVGLLCDVRDDGLESTGDGWFSGQLGCDNGADLYFYQVGVAAADASAPAGTPTPASGGASVAAAATIAPVAAPAAPAFPAGKMIKVVDLAPADALFPTKATIVGRVCSVVESPLVVTGDGLYAGRLFCDDGKSYQVFMARVTAN